ncbi:hypothetical protein, partial [Methylocystis parvus]|uniref:hypothetical protein n=1 Tax=Methylocystis parvus TaxID=134 RepID=UPI00059162B5
TDDDELTLAVEVEYVDDVKSTPALLRCIGAYSPPKEKSENVKDEKRGDEERHDCSENREQL